MATIHREGNVDLLSGKVAVIGYGSQGHAHALNLRDSGVEVEVGLRPLSPSREAAEDAGLTVRDIPEAVRGAQVVALLLPDHVQKDVYERAIEPHLEPDTTSSWSRRRRPGTASASCTNPARAPLASSPSTRTRAVRRSRLRWPTERRSAAAASACSRRRSRRRPRVTSSASRPCSAAARP